MKNFVSNVFKLSKYRIETDSYISIMHNVHVSHCFTKANTSEYLSWYLDLITSLTNPTCWYLITIMS